MNLYVSNFISTYSVLHKSLYDTDFVSIFELVRTANDFIAEAAHLKNFSTSYRDTTGKLNRVNFGKDLLVVLYLVTLYTLNYLSDFFYFI